VDLKSMGRTWINATTRPSEATFEREASKPYASLTTAFVWVIIVSAIVGIIGAINVLAGGLPADAEGALGDIALAGSGILMALSLVGLSVFQLVLFFAVASVMFLLARMFGGTGAYGKHVYIIATFAAPLTVVIGAMSFVPVLGTYLIYALVFYKTVLAFHAFKAVHDLPPVKAALVASVPLVYFIPFLLLKLIADYSSVATPPLG